MGEMEIASNDGIIYKGEIEDIVQLSKEQRTKLKFLTLVTNSPLIEKDGIEIDPEERQEKAILKTIQRIIGKNSIGDSVKEIKELIEKRVVVFPSEVQHNHRPDPQRNCIQKRAAIARFIATGKILKMKARVNPESKKVQRRLAYITESRIDSGKLLVSFSQDNLIVILKANINEGEMMSLLCAELLEMIDNNAFDYSLNTMECPCGGTTSPILTDVAFNFDGKTVVVESVPVLICSQCGKTYDDTFISIRTEHQAYKAMQEGKSKIEF